MNTDSQYLQSVLHGDIPLTREMGLEVLDWQQHTLRLHSVNGADRIALTVAGETSPDLDDLRADFQRRFAVRVDQLEVQPGHVGAGVQDDRH